MADHHHHHSGCGCAEEMKDTDPTGIGKEDFTNLFEI